MNLDLTGDLAPTPITAGGVTLPTRRLGVVHGGRPLVVGLHGGPGLDHHTLLPLARRLATRFEIWLPDLPGHGASVPPSGRLPGLPSLTEQTAAWMRGLPQNVDAVVGHSLGAWLVRELLRRRRLTVSAAVLVSPPAAGRRGGATALERAARVLTPPAKTPGAAGERRARGELLAHLRAECPEWPLAEMEADVARARLRPVTAYGALLRNLQRSLAGPQRSFDPGCPALVIAGARDGTTPPSEASQVAAATAGSRLEILEGAGHYPFAERPDATAACIVEFLTAVLSSPGAGR